MACLAGIGIDKSETILAQSELPSFFNTEDTNSGEFSFLAQEAPSYPDHIVNNDFEYWEGLPNMKNFAGEESDNWLYISIDKRQYGQTTLSGLITMPPEFKSEKFGWRSKQPQGGPQCAEGAVQINCGPDGNHYADLVTETIQKCIYQDVATTVGSVYKWQLKHSSSTAQLLDRMQVCIGPQGPDIFEKPQQYAQKVSRVSSLGANDTIGDLDTTIINTKWYGRNNNRDTKYWDVYEGAYIPDSPVTTFTFYDVNATNATNNWVDDISFSIADPLQYNLTGGSGELPKPQASGTYPGYHQRNSSVTLSDIIPTREGYTFLGWSDEELSDVMSTSQYEEIKSKIITTHTMHASTNTVYAVWGKNPTITFVDPFGSTGNSQIIDTYTIPFHTELAQELPTAPEHSGYRFSHYENVPSDKVDIDMTVMAVYDKEIPATASITWKDKDDTDQIRNSSFPQDSITLTLVHKSGDATKNKTIHLDATNDERDFEYLVPTDDDDIFPFDIELGEAPQGYSLAATAQVSDGRAHIDITATHVGVVRIPITKLWCDNNNADGARPDHINILFKSNQTRLLYDANAGVNAPESQMKNSSSASFVVADAGDMIRPGYEFMGWSELPNATIAQYQPGDTIDVSGITTLYAVWKEKTYSYRTAREYRINGKGVATVFNYTQYGHVGDKLSGDEIAAANPNWCTYKVDGEKLTFEYTGSDPETLTLSDSDDNIIILKYDINTEKTYTVIYTDGCNGDAFGNEEHGHCKPGQPTPPFEGSTDRYGYTFMGWAPTVNPKIAEDDANDGVIRYMATWTKRITVTWYDEDDTEIDRQTVSDINRLPEYSKELPTKPEDEYNTYEFSGWERQYDADGNISYYARYTAIPKVLPVEIITIIVNYVDINGDVVGTETLDWDNPTYDCSEFLNKENIPSGYYLVGVSDDGDPISGISDGNKTINITLDVKTAITVTWCDYNGTTLMGPVTCFKHDPLPEAEQYSPAPMRPFDGRYSYEFNKWNKETDKNGNVTYIASYRLAGVSINYGSTFALTSSFSDDEPTSVSWYSRDPSVAAVNENGVVTGNKIGMTEVVATCNGKEEIFAVSIIPSLPTDPVDPSPIDPTLTPMSLDSFSVMSLSNPIGTPKMNSSVAFHTMMTNDKKAEQGAIVKKAFTEPNGEWQQNKWTGYIELPAWDADTEEEFEYELMGEEKVDGYALINSTDTILEDNVSMHTFINSKVTDVGVVKEWVGAQSVGGEPDDAICEFFLNRFVLSGTLGQENQLGTPPGSAGENTGRDTDMFGDESEIRPPSRMTIQHNLTGINLAPIVEMHFECSATADSDWKGTFTNVPLYDVDGSLIDYVISENESRIPGWTMVAAYGNTLNGYRVLNSPETSVQIAKVWDDNGDERDIRPDEVVIRLADRNMMNDEGNGDKSPSSGGDIGGGILLMSLDDDTDDAEEPIFVNKMFGAILSADKVNEDGNWVSAINRIPLYDENGEKIDYVVNEMAPYGYAPLVEGSIDEGVFTVTNVYTHQDVLVNKTWNDDGYQLYRPKELELQLVPLNADGSPWDITDETEGGIEGGSGELGGDESGDLGFLELLSSEYETEHDENIIDEGDDSGAIPTLPAVNTIDIHMNARDEDTVVDGDEWYVTLHNVPVYLEDGTPINYAIEETEVPYGYNLASASYDAETKTASVVNDAWERTSLPSVGLNAILLFAIAGTALLLGGFTGALLKRRAKVKAMYMGSRAKKWRKKQ